jgi:putative transposase
MIDDAIAELTPVLGSKRAACTATGRPQANHYRRHRHPLCQDLVRQDLS